MTLRTRLPRLENAQLSSKRVLLRIEAESLIDQSAAISNPLPLLRILPTIHFLLQRGASVLILTNASHPQSKKALELHALAEYLSQALKQPVEYVRSSLNRDHKGDLEGSLSQAVVLLENLAFYPQEKGGEKKIRFPIG